MKKVFYILIIFAVASTSLFSCKEKEQKVTITKTVSFKTDFVDVYWRFKGIYYDKYLKQEVVYFSDFGKTSIKTFNLKGELMDSIPLENVLDNFVKRPIHFISPYSRDSIFCGGHNINKIVVIDHNGYICHTINIDNIIPDSLSSLYLFNVKNMPYQIKNPNNFLLRPHLTYYELLAMNNKSDLDIMSGLKFYYEIFHKSPYFFELKNIFSDNVEYRFGIYDFYKKHFASNDPSMALDAYFKEINNFIFIMSNSKNKIIKIKSENFETLQEINIKSKYTDMGYSYTIEENLNKTEKRIKASYAGRIGELFYNEKTKQYYVIVMHGIKDQEEYDSYNQFDYRPFSIIIYDENFENPKEYKFEGHTYICRNSFMTSEGLMMQRKPTNLTRENYGTQTFDLFDFN